VCEYVLGNVGTIKNNEPDQWSLDLGFDGPYKKPAQYWAYPWAWTSPVTNCGSCERGEPREPNIGILYVETGAWNIELLSFFSTTSPVLVIGRNRPYLPARRRRNHRPASIIVGAGARRELGLMLPRCLASWIPLAGWECT
jgi:hypothetical protein